MSPLRVPQIRMESQFAKIAIQTTPGKQSIEQPKADVSIEQPRGELSIHTRKGKLNIDQTKAWEDMNLHSPTRSRDLFAQEGLQAVSEGTSRRTNEGIELMRIENKGEPIASQAQTRSTDPMKTLGIQFIPSNFSVQIDYEPSDLEINYERKAPQISIQSNQPIHEFEPAVVDIDLEQIQQLEIDYINLFPEDTI